MRTWLALLAMISLRGSIMLKYQSWQSFPALLTSTNSRLFCQKVPRAYALSKLMLMVFNKSYYSDIEVVTPYPSLALWLDKHTTYLDTTGRPAIMFEYKDLTPQHAQTIYVSQCNSSLSTIISFVEKSRFAINSVLENTLENRLWCPLFSSGCSSSRLL
jgi:hypothetical protein